MKEEQLKKSLNELAEKTAEPVRAGLADDIKHRIPHQLRPHRSSWDTINIMIDLRISKLAAAAVIIITMALSAKFLGGRNSTGDMYQDSKLLIKYCLGAGNTDRSDSLAGMSEFYEHLANKDKDVAYYGDNIDPKDDNAVLMQWKLPDGKYRVIFGDMRSEIVGAEELIKLQARMLQRKTK